MNRELAFTLLSGAVSTKRNFNLLTNIVSCNVCYSKVTQCLYSKLAAGVESMYKLQMGGRVHENI